MTSPFGEKNDLVLMWAYGNISNCAKDGYVIGIKFSHQNLYESKMHW